MPDTETQEQTPPQGWNIQAPDRQVAPVVFSSPHSGKDYPLDFIAQSRLDLLALRQSEDAFVDELYAVAPGLGMPLLRALFPRAYIDPNREPFELDPAMFTDELPAYANTASNRVLAGLGTIARVVCTGREIYSAKLSFADAVQRINAYYRPYHRALRNLLDGTRRKFNCYVLIDCHSMPSVGGPQDPDVGRERPDFVLGDCFGSTCSPAALEVAERTLTALGYKVARNDPFAGGFTTNHYGRPEQGMHAMQIEIKRSLYMDEATIKPHDGFARLAGHIGELVEAMSGLDIDRLRAR